MSETPRVPSGVPESVQPAGLARSSQTPGARPAGPAFEALLERLTSRAAELDERARTLAAPEELPAALDSARASLEDALKLGSDLLEAYRAAQLGGEPGS